MTAAAFAVPGLLTDPAVRAALAWEPFRAGIEAAWLRRAQDGGSAAALLRYAPGATVPAHRHPGWEQILVLEGSQQDENGRYEAGCVVFNPPGTVHSVASPEGCVVLAIWERPVDLL